MGEADDTYVGNSAMTGSTADSGTVGSIDMGDFSDHAMQTVEEGRSVDGSFDGDQIEEWHDEDSVGGNSMITTRTGKSGASKSGMSSTRHTRKSKKGMSENEKLRMYQAQVPALLMRAYHLPGYNWKQDLGQYLVNSHPLWSICCHHQLHPIGFWMRIVALVGSVLFGLAVTQVIYLFFFLVDEDYDKGYLVIQSNFTTNQADLDENLAGINVTNGNLALWTVGAAVHAFYDNVIWEMAACTCMMKGDNKISRKLMRYQKYGNVLMIVSVVFTAALATFVVVLRATIDANEDDITGSDVKSGGLSDDEVQLLSGVDDASDFAFITSYAVEILLAYFFWYPTIGTLLFSGILGCYRIPVLGGRPYELRLEADEADRLAEQYRKNREEAEKQRKKDQLKLSDHGFSTPLGLGGSSHHGSAAPEQSLAGQKAPSSRSLFSSSRNLFQSSRSLFTRGSTHGPSSRNLWGSTHGPSSRNLGLGAVSDHSSVGQASGHSGGASTDDGSGAKKKKLRRKKKPGQVSFSDHGDSVPGSLHSDSIKPEFSMNFAIPEEENDSSGGEEDEFAGSCDEIVFDINDTGDDEDQQEQGEGQQDIEHVPNPEPEPVVEASTTMCPLEQEIMEEEAKQRSYSNMQVPGNEPEMIDQIADRLCRGSSHSKQDASSNVQMDEPESLLDHANEELDGESDDESDDDHDDGDDDDEDGESPESLNPDDKKLSKEERKAARKAEKKARKKAEKKARKKEEKRRAKEEEKKRAKEEEKSRKKKDKKEKKKSKGDKEAPSDDTVEKSIQQDLPVDDAEIC